jgi:ATP-dependent DNA ligase
MEARVRASLPHPPGWVYEPKWDGFRALAWGEGPRLDSRNERPLLRYFPELAPAVDALPNGTVVDGEVVVVRHGVTDFDALQQRIHPAGSRIAALAEATPAGLVAFDVLADRGDDLRGASFADRRAALTRLVATLPQPWHLTPSADDLDEAQRWFSEFEAAGCDGIVAKQRDGAYACGERAMVKVKHRRTVDAVVAGYRLHKHGDRLGSLLLGLYDEAGSLHFVGHCSGFSDDERVSLLAALRPLEAAAGAGFGENARQPGEPSRWSGDKDLSWVALRPELVVEISYDQLAGWRLRHAARLERWRADKPASACGMDQLVRPVGPSFGEVVEGRPEARG